jgi:hypothetical protein
VAQRRRLVVLAILAGLAAGGCAADAAPLGSDAPLDPPTGGGEDGGEEPQAGGTSAARAGGGACPEPVGEVQPWTDGPSADLVALADGGDGPAVYAAVYPRPDYEGNPWSQWGQGVVLEDGRFISAIGDHIGVDGNSYLYEFDPAAGRLTQISDVLSVSDLQPGEGGYGKIHAQMVAGPCGEVYAATYWGTVRKVAYRGNYRGDVLLRLDPSARTIENMGVILEDHGVPSMAGWPEGGLLYAEAANPELHEPQRGAFVALDMATGEQVFATEDEEDHRGFRAMVVDADGGVLFSRADGRVARWDPATEEVSDLDVTLPGKFLRAATPPAPDGTVYLITEKPDVLFALGADGELRELGQADGYTASLAMAPDGSRLWYVPHAHGGAAEVGTPVIEVDTMTGEQRTVVELDPLAQDALGLSLGGTYNVAVDAAGTTLYIGMNAAEPDADDLFGEIVLVIVELE